MNSYAWKDPAWHPYSIQRFLSGSPSQNQVREKLAEHSQENPHDLFKNAMYACTRQNITEAVRQEPGCEGESRDECYGARKIQYKLNCAEIMGTIVSYPTFDASNVGFGYGASALWFVISRGDPQWVHLVLKAKNSDVNRLDGIGQSALEYVLDNHYGESAQEMIDAGADVEARMAIDNNSTLLMRQARACNAEAVYLLIENNADVHATNKLFENAETMAIAQSSHAVVYRNGTIEGKDWHKECVKTVRVLRNADKIKKKARPS